MPEVWGYKMNWLLIPYVEYNGAWTLNDDRLSDIYKQIKGAGLIEKVFYEGEIRLFPDWVTLMKRQCNLVHTIWGEDKKLYLIAWLNDWGKSHAFVHFITLPRAWGKYTGELLSMSFKYWFDLKDKPGGPLLETLIGRTPANRKELTHFLRKVGGHILGTIPNMSYDMYSNKKVDIVISYITREDL